VNKKTSVVVPLYNSTWTLEKTLVSLNNQQDVEIELVLVDDFSSDNPVKSVERYFLEQKAVGAIKEWKLIRHNFYHGLARTYNSGVSESTHPQIVFMQPDVRLPSSSELTSLLKPFENPIVVGSTHRSIAPELHYWEELNIWGKAFLAPSLFSRAHGFNGQFDALRRDAFLKIDGFDGVRFLNAGEDGDITFRISKFGEVHNSEASAQHCHYFGTEPNAFDYLSKAIQYGNAQGALIRNHRISGAISKVVILHREVICLLIVISLIIQNKWALLASFTLLIISSSRLPVRLFRNRYINRTATIKLLAAEIVKHFVHLIGSFVGFIEGRQRIRLVSDLWKRRHQ